MAVCNLFKQLSKETGNFLMFDQYSNDLTRCYVQHDSYDVVPSKFVALDINYLKFTKPAGDKNQVIPTFFQNYYENGCAWLKSSKIGENDSEYSWNPEDWNPSISSNIFWNSLIKNQILNIETQEGENPYDYISEIRYVGNIDIHSYEEKDGVGYSEVYCYIPNSAARKIYEVRTENPDRYFMYKDKYCMGFDESSESIAGILPLEAEGIIYHYDPCYVFHGHGDDDVSHIHDYNDNKFSFNTIVLLYDILVRDSEGKITTEYKDIPMGIYFTGLWNDTEQSMTNKVVKYSTCEDAYNSGTSYGLRVCTRYMCTPNATTITNIEIQPADQYAGFSQAMSKMSESQSKMDEMLADAYKQSQDMKDAIMAFKNSKANCPYIREINDTPYWFINGRNTGVQANGAPGAPGLNGTRVTLEYVNGDYYFALDGNITGIRANGRDGIPGRDGTPGKDGAPGVTPEITIQPAHDSGILHWYINGQDTGVPTTGADGKNGLPGKDAPKPNIVTTPDGAKYWYIGSAPTYVRADGTAGKSIWLLTNVVLDSDVKIYDKKLYFRNTTGDVWNENDLILYEGPNRIGKEYSILTNDLYRVQKFATNYAMWRVVKVGNISSTIDEYIKDIEVKPDGNDINIVLKNDKEVQQYHIKNPNNTLVSHSTKQKKYHHLHDTIYCCGRPAYPGETFLEIPYTRVFDSYKEGDETYWRMSIKIDPKYSGFQGEIVVKPTKIFALNQDIDNLWYKSNNHYYKYDPSKHGELKGTMIKKMYRLVNREHIQYIPAFLKFDSSNVDHIDYKNLTFNTSHIEAFKKDSDIFGKYKLSIVDPIEYVIWPKLTESEKQALNHSYKISGHIGRVCAYVDMYGIYSKKSKISLSQITRGGLPVKPKGLEDEALNNPANVYCEGILSYNNGKWFTQSTATPVKVSRHNMNVFKYKHTSSNSTPIIKNIDELLSRYNPDNMWIYRQNNNKIFTWMRNGSRLTKHRSFIKEKYIDMFDPKSPVREYDNIYAHLSDKYPYRRKWIKHSKHSGFKLQHDTLWKWYAMNEIADMIMSQTGHSTLTREAPYSKVDWDELVSRGMADRESLIPQKYETIDSNKYTSSSNKYVYIACGSKGSRKDIYKISLKWVRNKTYNPNVAEKNPYELYGDISKHYDPTFDYTTLIGESSEGIMYPIRGIFGWELKYTTEPCKSYRLGDNDLISSQTKRRIRGTIINNSSTLNRKYYAKLVIDYVKTIDDIQKDFASSSISIDGIKNSLKHSLKGKYYTYTNTGEQGELELAVTSPSYSHLSYNIKTDMTSGKDNYDTDSLDIFGYFATSSKNTIKDIWGHSICWETPHIISTINNIPCIAKPLNTIIYCKKDNKILPIVNLTWDTLYDIIDNQESKTIDNIQYLNVHDGELVIDTVSNVTYSDLVDSNGNPLIEDGNIDYTLKYPKMIWSK